MTTALDELNEMALHIQRKLGYPLCDEADCFPGSNSFSSNPLSDMWILYQFNTETNLCDLKEIFQT
jgi:hypothetical protein